MNLHNLNPHRFNPEILYIYHCLNENYRGRNHAHDFLELSIVLDGVVSYNVEGETIQATKGDVFLFNPGVHHFEFAEGTGKNSQLHIGFRNFQFDGSLRHTIPLTTAYIPLNKHVATILALCHDLIKEKEQKDPGYEIILKASFMQLLILTLRELQPQSKEVSWNGLAFESNEKQQIVQTIIAYMEDNYMNDISLTKLSENMYLSPVYISKIFKEETGDSPINYLIQIRLFQADKLLRGGNHSVKTAAKAVGYTDAYYFSKLFKKHYGFPPSHVLKKSNR